MDVVEISGLRVFCVLWIILVHVTTVLYYVAGKDVFNWTIFYSFRFFRLNAATAAV